MNILFLTDILPSGGNRTYIVSASQAFAAKGHAVSLLGFSQGLSHDLPTQHFAQVRTIRVKSFRAPFLLTRLISLHRLLRQFLAVTPADYIIVDLIDPAASLLIVKLFLKVVLKDTQIIYQFHGLPSMEMHYTQQDKESAASLSKLLGVVKHRLRLVFDRWVLNSLPDRVVVFSEYSKKLLKTAGVTSSTICIKPGIDAELADAGRGLSRAKAREIVGLNPTQRVILIASRLEARKGVLAFFRALADSKLRYQNCTFLVVSDFWNDPDTHAYYQVLAKQQLGTKVFSISRPSRFEMAVLYHAADVTIVPSLDLETFGFVSLESMRFGTPVVAFAIGANPEMIPAGMLAKRAAYSQLQRKVDKVLTASPLERKKLHETIEKKMVEYDWKNYITHFMKHSIVIR